MACYSLSILTKWILRIYWYWQYCFLTASSWSKVLKETLFLLWFLLLLAWNQVKKITNQKKNFANKNCSKSNKKCYKRIKKYSRKKIDLCVANCDLIFPRGIYCGIVWPYSCVIWPFHGLNGLFMVFHGKISILLDLYRLFSRSKNKIQIHLVLFLFNWKPFPILP